jgi:hypothetical protein
MELMIKLYSDRPSRIGIKYPTEYQAIKSYEEIIKKHQGGAFSLRIELIKNKANLFLFSEQTGGRIAYKDVEYKADQLKKLEMNLASGLTLEFVHVYAQLNTLLIAKPFRKQQFVTLSNTEIVDPIYFSRGV